MTRKWRDDDPVKTNEKLRDDEPIVWWASAAVTAALVFGVCIVIVALVMRFLQWLF